MAKKIKVRELSLVEKEWIGENINKLALDLIYAKLVDVDKATINKFVEENYPAIDIEGQKRSDRTAKLFARDVERGVVTMTPAASEMADARRAHYVPSIDKSVRNQPDKIFIMDPDKKAR